ncbi:hypothetical protein CCMSSC00406_0008613 [Pleurotus cornucopiae]|uniref:Uncharacterized protein n=1 Tax=Pleurotus cornucopiae TaxID=5321 RepID=A0ACB7IHX2_PLECO|nr:hypothetical protein CCMSSC00406_0008613 [Pleurotus cornucopiae]
MLVRRSARHLPTNKGFKRSRLSSPSPQSTPSSSSSFKFKANTDEEDDEEGEKDIHRYKAKMAKKSGKRKSRGALILKLPVEIIDDLVGRMDKSEQIAFSSACLAIRRIALRHIFRSICLRSPLMAMKFCKAVERDRDWVPLIRSLTLSIMPDTMSPSKKEQTALRRLGPKLVRAVTHLSNLRSLDIRDSILCQMTDILAQATLPLLRAFSYTSLEAITDVDALAHHFVARHQDLEELALKISAHNRMFSSAPSNTSDIATPHELPDKIRHLSKLRSFVGPCSFIADHIDGLMPLATASLEWTAPSYPDIPFAVGRPIRSLAQASAQKLTTLECNVFRWIPRLLDFVVEHLPVLESLTVLEGMPTLDPDIKPEMCAMLPKFKTLTSFRLDPQFMAGEQFMEEYQRFYEEAVVELQATCPRLSCSLYAVSVKDSCSIYEFAPGADLSALAEHFLGDNVIPTIL